ncbi:DUF1659 domain-containing protein [Cytobacillus spongiae]|jgi:hypothetical protein|uniref:DUF1659 domain-containing protein n=1 Tax=Cytobacillus spongiae TaxID=2901381 RepID=UPI001F2EFB83|nr:DUF1659 domain-containing protein [Cytobacillus spongiae]UII57676.1 DUF1659 domain-containing protein [Cytobacillus spongiae]
MAQEMLTESKLRLSFETGVDEKGEPILKAKAYSNVKGTATADQLHAVGQAIASLCKDPLFSVERDDRSEIIG